MGVMMAPVVGSGSWPAWMQSVANPILVYLLPYRRKCYSHPKQRLRAARDSLPRSARGFKGVRRSTPLLKVLENPLAQIPLEAVGQDGDDHGSRAHLPGHVARREDGRARGSA